MLKTIHDELETFWVGSLHNHSFDNHCEIECFRHAFARMSVCLGSGVGGGGGDTFLNSPLVFNKLTRQSNNYVDFFTNFIGSIRQAD